MMAAVAACLGMTTTRGGRFRCLHDSDSGGTTRPAANIGDILDQQAACNLWLVCAATGLSAAKLNGTHRLRDP